MEVEKAKEVGKDRKVKKSLPNLKRNRGDFTYYVLADARANSTPFHILVEVNKTYIIR